MIVTWNCLAASILVARAFQRAMQTFEKKMYGRMRQMDWYWFNDRL